MPPLDRVLLCRPARVGYPDGLRVEELDLGHEFADRLAELNSNGEHHWLSNPFVYIFSQCAAHWQWLADAVLVTGRDAKSGCIARRLGLAGEHALSDVDLECDAII